MNSTQLGQLYEQYGYFVHRRCLSLLRHPADAEDVTQEVFMRVYRYQSSLKGPVTLAWLNAIAARCCFDYLARARETSTDPHRLPEAADDVGAALAERRAFALQLLHDLDGAGREIALLHHLEGFTQEEVAQRTGYSRKTIGKKLAALSEAITKRWRARPKESAS